MSIVVAHGYSVMYVDQDQTTDEPAGPLSGTVAPYPFRPASFGKDGVAPSSLVELNKYSSVDDFDTSGIGDAPWDDPWPPVTWAKVDGKYYTWDGTGPGDGWIPFAFTEGDVLPGDTEGFPPGIPADELVFMGRYPQTKRELDKVTPSPDTYFANGTYVRLVGQGIGAQYFWNGTKWLAGVSDD